MVGDTCLSYLTCLWADWWEQRRLEMVDPKFISDICEIRSYQTSLTGKEMTVPSNCGASTLGNLEKRPGT